MSPLKQLMAWLFGTLYIAGLPVLGQSYKYQSGPDFATVDAPILESKCLQCHNPNILKGEFSMATKEDILAAEDDFLIPGNAEDSMVHWITLPFEGEPPEMPNEGEPLSDNEAALLAEWINAGAHWPDGLVLKDVLA